MKMKTTWQGKDLIDCTKEELIDALDGFMEFRYEMSNHSKDREIEKLREELRIKNDIIDRMLGAHRNTNL